MDDPGPGERVAVLQACLDEFETVLEKLAASYRAEETRVADRRSQKELDDLAGRRVRAALGSEGDAP